VEAQRYATQAFGLALSLALLALVWLLRKRWPFRGAAFLMFNFLYFAAQFMLEYVRGDETLYLAGWRLPQLLDLALALLAGAALLILWWKARGGSSALILEPAEAAPEEEESGEEIEVEEPDAAPEEEGEPEPGLAPQAPAEGAPA
jgi:prolipoprotein diacylglyceryltransferase